MEGMRKLICKAETDTYVENNADIKVGKRSGGMDWETGIGIHTLLCIKQTIKENLLYSTGNSTWCFVVIYMERKSKRGDICISKKSYDKDSILKSKDNTLPTKVRTKLRFFQWSCMDVRVGL